MRLLLTTDTVGGVWTYCVELARALACHDVQIALATMGAPLSADQRRQVQSLEHVALFESEYRLEWMPSPWEDVAAAGDWLLEVEQIFRPDVIHLNGYAHGVLEWKSPVLVAAHSCVCSWWEAVKREQPPAEWDRYRDAVRDGVHSADLVVAPSHAMLEMVERHYGSPPATRVIPNARDPELFHRSAKLSFVFSAGRLWDEAKNIAAVERVAPRLPWPVAVAGEGGSGLSSQVVWLGRLREPEIADWLARAWIYVLPAFYEPFGLSILEAAMSGCALVLGDIPSLRENWDGAARFVDPRDDSELEHVIQELISDHRARVALATISTARAHRFLPDAFAGEYSDAYRRLCGLNRTASCAS